MATRTSSKVGICVVTLALAGSLAARPAGAQAASGADLYVPPGIGVHTWVGQQTHPVAANVVNFGDLPAEDVALTLRVSAGWTVAAPTETDPPGASCAVATDQRSVTCTFDEVAPGGGVGTYLSPVTSPAGPTSPAAVTVSASSPTPDLGEWPNEASDTLPHQGGSIVVSPSIGLVHGQTVRVDLTGRAPGTGYLMAMCDSASPSSIGDCDTSTVSGATTNALGSASVDRAVRRFITTGNGLFDCAKVTCSLGIAVATSLTPVGAAPLGFADVEPPSTGVGVTLSGTGHLFSDPDGPATVSVDLSCAIAGDVAVEFSLHQVASGTQPTQRETNTITVPCIPGDPVAITSDLLGTRVLPGTATVLVRATSVAGEGWAFGEVVMRSHAEVRAELQARLDDPEDPDAAAELVQGLLFRVTHNPEFAREFWRAVFLALLD